MHELGAVQVTVRDVYVDFRRPTPWATGDVPEKHEITPAGERVEVHEPLGEPAPPDAFEQWLNTLPVPTFKR